MRAPHFVAIALAVVAASATSAATASAADLKPTHVSGHAPRAHATGYVWGTFPGGPDPYEYRYRPSGYYPYYNSDYWRTRADMRYRTHGRPNLLGEYWSSWGYPVKCADRTCRKRVSYKGPTK